MSALRAGQLNRRITLQRPSNAQDNFGAVQSTWIDVATVWADIQPLSGRELENARRMASEISHQITLRYQTLFTDTGPAGPTTGNLPATGSTGNWNTDFQNTSVSNSRFHGDTAGNAGNPGATWWFHESIYDRIDGDKITQVGVSAQSLQALLPDAIQTANDDMKTLSVSYGNAALASAVELAKEVVSLRQRLERLVLDKYVAQAALTTAPMPWAPVLEMLIPDSINQGQT